MQPETFRSPYARPLTGTLRRSALIGAIVVALDVWLLGALVEGGGLSQAVANIPALGTGLLVAFFGNKYFAFRDHSRRLGRQGAAFLLVAAAAIAYRFYGQIFHATRPAHA
jgi:putative flippase GtrA